MPFLNKSFSSSFSSSSNSSSWAWPSCHQNPRTTSFRTTIIAINTNDIEDEEEEEERPLHAMISSSPSSSTSSTIVAVEELPETESIENVIKGIKSSKRLIFERKGESNSILEEMRNKDSSHSCPWNHSTFSSLISSESWLKWLRYTRIITAREASKCMGKTAK
ncbi:hypothetical protein AALP_AA5G153900 [Arabis alpina]|uniref:Uncharacterized protein n=1 Tax=Arabis alpina TaxID=50452 RepID=A0A087GXA2_ARAAL|nr:hypothetical protein AALP_AA5G153900 [Arabis alpina]